MREKVIDFIKTIGPMDWDFYLVNPDGFILGTVHNDGSGVKFDENTSISCIFVGFWHYCREDGIYNIENRWRIFAFLNSEETNKHYKTLQGIGGASLFQFGKTWFLMLPQTRDTAIHSGTSNMPIGWKTDYGQK